LKKISFPKFQKLFLKKLACRKFKENICIIQGVSKVPGRLDNKVVTSGHMWSKAVQTG